MENKILQQNVYTALQLSLPIDLGIKIDEDAVVVSFPKTLEGGVNLSKYFKRGKCRGRKGYKTVSRDVVLNEFYAEVDKNLSTEQRKEMKKQRRIWSNQTRYEIHKIYKKMIKNTRMEFLLVCIGLNKKPKEADYKLANDTKK